MLPSELTINISAASVAWYAAIVSTASIGITMWNSWRDRARIVIRYRKDIEIVNQNGAAVSKPLLEITVMNIGRRPIKLGNVAIRMVGEARKFKVLTDCLIGSSRILTEEQPATDFRVEQDLIAFDHAWFISVSDATGREYRLYLHPLPRLWRALFWIRYRK